MRTIRFLALAALGAIMFTGCNKDNNGIDPGTGGIAGGDITFNIGFAPQVQTKVATDAQFKSTWENDDAIGIYAVKRASGDTKALTANGNYMQNVKLTYNKTDGKWTGEAYYTNDGEVLDLYAYYPYDTAATNPANITFNVATDQSTAVNYNASDLLSAKQAGVRKGTTVDLTFAHKLALVQVEIDSGAMKGSGPSENLAITLRNCKTGGAFNLDDGSLITSGVAQAVKMLRVETDPATASTYTYRALVPAQIIAKDNNLCLMAQNGQLYNTPALAAALELKAGDAKLYTAELPASALQTVKITKGTFQMGEEGYATPVHKVTLTKDFYMSKYQVTNAQYAAFLNAKSIGSNGEGSVTYYKNDFTTPVTETKTFIKTHAWGVKWDSGSSKWIHASGYDNHPVIDVSWFGAKAYADWIGGSLPTEAQWEYACRAGTTTAFSFGNNDAYMDNYGWSSENSSDGTKVVGQKIANTWGLYDMHGNVWEWCSDWYGAYSGTAATDPPGAPKGTHRLLRGGGWRYSAQDCRSAFRNYSLPVNAFIDVGFRVVFVP